MIAEMKRRKFVTLLGGAGPKSYCMLWRTKRPNKAGIRTPSFAVRRAAVSERPICLALIGWLWPI